MSMEVSRRGLFQALAAALAATPSVLAGLGKPSKVWSFTGKMIPHAGLREVSPGVVARYTAEGFYEPVAVHFEGQTALPNDSVEEFRKIYLEPAAKAYAERIEADLFKMYKKIGRRRWVPGPPDETGRRKWIPRRDVLY